MDVLEQLGYRHEAALGSEDEAVLAPTPKDAEQGFTGDVLTHDAVEPLFVLVQLGVGLVLLRFAGYLCVMVGKIGQADHFLSVK